MKLLKPPSCYKEIIWPIIAQGNPGWNEEKIENAVTMHWDSADNQIKMIFVEPIVKNAVPIAMDQFRQELIDDIKKLICEDIIDKVVEKQQRTWAQLHGDCLETSTISVEID